MSFEHVKVLPFVGEKYKKKTPFGLPILILGEPHYSENGEPLDSEFTKRVVQESLGGKNYPFFAKVAGVFQGSWPDHNYRRQFWSSVVFYNFVQETVGPNSRIRPNGTMWNEAGPALQEVLVEYQPGFVLILENELWANLPVPLKPGPPVTLADGQSKESRLYFNDSGYAFTFGIAHPASAGAIRSGHLGFWPLFLAQLSFRERKKAKPWTKRCPGCESFLQQAWL